MSGRTKLAVLFLGAALAGGCSAGYPSTEERIENVDATIKKQGLMGTRNDARDSRFFAESGVIPDTTEKK